jgi:hypothetical protein
MSSQPVSQPGNGKTNPQVVAAQQRAAGTRTRLNECQQALALAQRAHNQASDAYTDDDTQANRAALLRTREEVRAAESRVRGFGKKFAEDEATCAPLDGVYQAACVQLAQIQLQANFEVAEHEKQVIEHKLYDAEATVLALRNQLDAAEQRRMALLAQINHGRWSAARAAALTKFRQDNPSVRQHGLERTSHSL